MPQQPDFMNAFKPPPPPMPKKLWSKEKDDTVMYIMVGLALLSMVLKWWVRWGGLQKTVPKVNRNFDRYYEKHMRERRRPKTKEFHSSVRILSAALFSPATSTTRRESNPLVFMDITVDGKELGRIVIELRKDVVPKTAANFLALCRGDQVTP